VSFTVWVDEQGLDRAVARVARLGERAEDTGPLWRQIRAAFLAAGEQRFSSRGRGWWAPDLPETIARKTAAGQDPRTLRATGGLHRSLTAPGAAGAVFEPRRDRVTLGTSVPHAVYHQGGEGREDRRVIVVTRGMREGFAAAIGDWVTD